MTKYGLYERIIYIVIFSIFLLSGFAPIVLPLYDFNKHTNQLSSYYYSLLYLFDNPKDIFFQTILLLPLVSSIVAISCLVYEILFRKNKVNNGYVFGVSTFVFIISGLLYATYTNCLIPFGAIILATGLGVGINKIIFHYGFRGSKY